MTFGIILETLILGPLKLLFECVFQFANSMIYNPPLAIIVMSLVVNLVSFPLYRRADIMQKEARDIEEMLRDGVQHIKKSFSGDERMMMLQTYYRQNNYKPTQAIKGSTSLLLQIPFFMAAYGFLSNLQDLKGVSFGPIADLSAPDGLVVIGGFAINVLPIIMTAINFVSSAIYLKGFPIKNKLQIYGMAIFFLIFLYPSPSGLVFYWTCNNFFSLCKTILYKLKNPQRVIGIAASLLGVALIVLGFVKFDGSLLKKLLVITIGLLLQIGLFASPIKKFASKHIKPTTQQPDNKLFTVGSCFLSVLCGALISSAFIADSPKEFVDVTYFYHPLWHVLSTFCFAAGTFLVWFRVFYWLSNSTFKVIFGKVVWILSGVMLVNYMFFGRNLGNISAELKYDRDISFAADEQLINIAVMLVLVAVLIFIVTKWKKAAISILAVATVAVAVMSGVNMYSIKKSVDTVVIDEMAAMPSFNLDKSGKNVVVIMLDRAVGTYAPYIFNEKPELKEKFDGFTHYSNTLSYGMSTNFGVPPLLGGYEYTPVEMNKRDTEPLVKKHNESLKVMPVLFSENNFEVTLCNPPYANYSWIPDLSIFDEYPGIDAYNTHGIFESEEQKEQSIAAVRRNFFCYSIMKGSPVSIQRFIYDYGRYRKTEVVGEYFYTGQIMENVSVGRGFRKNFMRDFLTLNHMSDMTEITQNGNDTYLFFSSNITHEQAIMQTPDYLPKLMIDNTKYDAEHADRFTVDGETIKVSTINQMSHYHINMAAMIQLGNWLDYLKENDVYDNTRIIIVADHGRALGSSEEYKFSNFSHDGLTAESFYPLLLVKDFDAEGFTASDEFMTNADVPVLAMQGLIDNPVNPFTGNPINSDEKLAHDQLVIMSTVWGVEDHPGNTFQPSKWGAVSKDLHNSQNWSFYSEKTVLKEHKLPQ